MRVRSLMLASVLSLGALACTGTLVQTPAPPLPTTNSSGPRVADSSLLDTIVDPWAGRPDADTDCEVYGECGTVEARPAPPIPVPSGAAQPAPQGQGPSRFNPTGI